MLNWGPTFDDVNDSEETVSSNSWICFSDETQGDYPALGRTCWGGFDPFEYSGSGPGSSDPLGVNMEGMLGYTASLIELED